MIRKYWRDIKEKTSGMNRQETCSYILAYYWYHILIFVSIAALVVLFAAHYAFGNKKPEFTCIIVNQEMDAARDQEMADAFAKEAGLPENRVVIDSDYQFSYGEFRLEGANESSYEKFFFQWQNQEIDAVIMSESFYRHCKEMGGRFRVLEEQETEGFTVYMEEGQCSAVVLGNDSFTERVTGKADEKLLLAFPSSGQHTAESRSFLKYLQGKVI
ncbi:hypothetical protein E5329_10060 [Petralouisia muris]|uniref:Uncharacterized protein n=1 Tax=Petralouisia muris TaxID=3032872 RepID=A0AC61RXH2_9FIRM|nr:hypothetical protein [Petralouisia muris]TGY96362.1 hypothetical protein E5329_10060 [Petralouisia muris]